ncbi:4Fe-4S binding protein [Desulforhopalus singaporensis]|uniref:2-oxoglutarate ferredoxin oxidoreductase subunit delta n=1 Tax=Desulforhopalus singaporensis TaxID=91360 RepID=A0A1H0SBT7_9BACT|nr:4Fe-4S binding protein [Desulforhopalus singaporensis]SDP39214.1 2-oxoglutarate ferredoxin oxidoreductase subunit delta [Desulforhopalus singaporensis]
MTKASKKRLHMVQHHERCKGCGFCILECPKEALSVSDDVNRKGYPLVKLDEEKCIVCAICHTVCPDYVFERREVA